MTKSTRTALDGSRRAHGSLAAARSSFFLHSFVIRFSTFVLPLQLVLACPQGADALDTVRYERDGQMHRVIGRLLVKAQDGGVLMEAPDGVLWAVQPDEIVSVESNGGEFKRLDEEQFAAALLHELPPGFQVHHTAHYAICYNTSREYAAWCGGLFERLYRAFTNFWSRRGFDLHDPEYPLPVIIFTDAGQYAEFAKPELGDAASSIVAYYSLRTNRVIMHDLTGVESLRAQRGTRGRLSIDGLLAQTAAEPLVATVIHEATHQIAFNCGLHTRYADVPLWLSEGLAIYFETPDLSSRTGWRAIGRVNHGRLATFRRNVAGRSPDRLAELIASDRLFRDTQTGPEAYAEAWALTHYLLRARQEEYIAYLKMLAEKPRLVWDDEATRIAEFRKHFGSDLAGLSAAVAEYAASLR